MTARSPEGRACGLTANAVTSLSLEPPLVLACVERSSETHGCILAAGAFAVSVLRADQEPLARRFAAGDGEHKFRDVATREERTGAPVLADTLAWLDCELWSTYEGGDHTIFVGQVVAGDAPGGVPLAYYRGGFARLDR